MALAAQNASAVGTPMSMNYNFALPTVPGGGVEIRVTAHLAEEPTEVTDMVAEFDRRRGKIVSGLRALGLPCEMPKGAFYVFPDVSAHLDEEDSMGFCERLLEEVGVASVPGGAFGTEGHIRLSYALAEDAITEALERLGRFLNES